MICPACRKDITRVMSNTDHVPRWAKTPAEKYCSVVECKDTVFSALHKTSSQEIEQLFISCGLRSTTPSIPIPTPLCKHHYHLIYNKVEPRQVHCITCGTSLRNAKSKACPQPTIIEPYLRENMGFEGNIKESDKVCYACYRSHLIILQKRNEISTDSDLADLITTLSHQIHAPNTIQSTSDLIDAAMTRVVVSVGRELLDGNVMLLPDVHELFNSNASQLSQHLHENINIPELVTSAYVLSNLTANLQHHIMFSCKVKKYGTLIYRPNSDLRTVASGTANPPDHREVLDDLNTRACSHVASCVSKYEHQLFDFLDLDIDKEIESTDPKLWVAVCLLTRSTSERKGLAKVTDCSTGAHHTKKICRFFLLTTLLHCINDRYTNPLHTYITDLIEGQGGSALLIKIMNQFGACSSSDTLSRYIQKKVSTPRKRISQCLSQAFTIITVDNIDFLHSYARLYKGSNNSSWHGTTIQAVQPLPSLSIHTQADVHPHSTPQSISNTHNLVPSDQIESPLATGLSGSANSQATLGLNIQLMDIHVNASSENDLDLRTMGESSYGGNTNITRSLHPKQADGNAEITYRCALNRKKER